MNARLAVRRVWGTASIWVSGTEPQPAIAAEAVVVQATVVHVIHSLPDRPERDQVRRFGAGEGRLWDRDRGT